MTKIMLPFEARHDPRRLRRAIVAAALMVAIGLALPFLAFGFSEVPLAAHLPLLIAVSGGLLGLGALLASLGIARLKDPVYLAVEANGRGRFRPFIRVKPCHFPLESPVLQGARLTWAGKPRGCGATLAPDGTYYLSLPETVSIHRP